MENPTLIGTIVAGLGLVLGLLAAGHALLRKRRPQSAFGWIAVSLSVPFVGALLYFFFGINRVQTAARKLRAEGDREPAAPPYGVSIAPTQTQPLARLGEAVSGMPLTGGNHVATLHNGEQAYPAMLEAIENASTRVFVSSYIFDSGRVGRDFARALTAAAERGVDVRVLIDGVGELYSWPPVRKLLRGTKVRFAKFLPPTLLPPSFHFNLRNHRKILVVDGGLAFTGGMNITNRCLVSEAPPKHRVVDMHFRLEGPVAAQIEAVFVADWRFATNDDTPVPPVEAAPSGQARCRAVIDGPDGDVDRLIALLVGAFGSARRRVAVMTPYFLPPRALIGTLQAAALSGVDVAIILPARNNLPYIHRATRHMLWELLIRGVQVYFQPPPFVHSKMLLIDDHYAFVGSANIDPRSLRLNFELNVEVHDADLVTDLGRHFEEVRSRSTAVKLADVDGRSLPTRLIDGAAWLFSPYL